MTVAEDIGDSGIGGGDADGRPGASRSRLLAQLFSATAFLAALGIVTIFVAIIYTLYRGAEPSLRAFGPSFLLSEAWNPVNEKFGALPAIYGTLVTSSLAMLVALD